MAGFGAKGRGGRKKLFDDRVSKDKPQDAQRIEKLHNAINYRPRERYPSCMHKEADLDPRSLNRSTDTVRYSMSNTTVRSFQTGSDNRHAIIWAGVDLKLPIPPRPKTEEYDEQRGWLMPLEKMSYPVSPAATPREQAIIEKWKKMHKEIREGPLFVRRVVDSNARVGKTSGAANTGASAFNSLTTYSARYERKYRQRPNHTGKLWLKEFLPRELWEVVDPSLRKSTTSTTAPTQTSATAIPKTRFNIPDFSDDEASLKADDDADNDSDAENAAEGAEEKDEDWEDDEDDNDDYNAENYFSGGEGDDVVADDAEFGDEVGGGEIENEREYGRDEEFDV